MGGARPRHGCDTRCITAAGIHSLFSLKCTRANNVTLRWCRQRRRSWPKTKRNWRISVAWMIKCVLLRLLILLNATDDARWVKDEADGIRYGKNVHLLAWYFLVLQFLDLIKLSIRPGCKRSIQQLALLNKKQLAPTSQRQQEYDVEYVGSCFPPHSP